MSTLNQHKQWIRYCENCEQYLDEEHFHEEAGVVDTLCKQCRRQEDYFNNFKAKLRSKPCHN